MDRDPIVEEVRAARAKIWEECGRDFNRLFKRLEEASKAHPERMIGLEEFRRRFGQGEEERPPTSRKIDENARSA